MAEFKAEFLNAFVERERIASVIEFGCGDGNQLTLAAYPRYIGLDVSASVIRRCIDRFRDDAAKSFFVYDTTAFADRQGVFRAELAMSLDVLYHLVEDDIFERYMQHLFDAGSRFVVVYSSNHEERDAAPHVRHRRFTDWVETHIAGWKLLDRVANAYAFDPKTKDDTSTADFFIFKKTAGA